MNIVNILIYISLGVVVLYSGIGLWHLAKKAFWKARDRRWAKTTVSLAEMWGKRK